MLPSEIMIWQPEFTDKILSRKPGAVHPTYLLRTYVSSAGIGLNEQKDHAEGKLGFQSWGEPS
ncbi:hypothetical protein H5R22_14860 [Escherichia coli]|nr:hypothetical protein [Escherichia coli]MBZ8630744.1 hypothetical protein [Escherichia coli]